MTEASGVTVSETPKGGTMSALRSKSYEGGNCGDSVAEALKGADFTHLKALAVELGIDVAKYDNLNPGQQRMNIGNRLRKLVKGDANILARLQAVPRAEVKEKPKAAPKADTASSDSEASASKSRGKRLAAQGAAA